MRPAAIAIALAALVLGASCKDKARAKPAPPPAQLTGLAAVPASARVVIGADPARLAGSPLMARAARLMIEREPVLGERIARLAAGCGLDWQTQVESLHLALTDDAPQVLMIVTGALVETELTRCVRSTVGEGGGTVTLTQVDGRSLYQVSDQGRTIYFAFGQTDTIVLSASRELVLAGLGTGPKVMDAPEMKALIDRSDTHAPLWAAGKVDPAWSPRLLRLMNGALETPPKAFLGVVDASDGLRAQLSAVMGSEADAKVMESQLKPTLELVSLVAQARGLGPLAAKVVGVRDGDAIRFGVELTAEEVKELLSKVDTTAPAAQDAAPAPTLDAGAPGD